MKRWIPFFGVLALLLLLPGIASAQGPIDGSGNGHVFSGQDVSLKPGETFEGDLSVFDGNLDMAEGSAVLGDVFVTKGHATIAGQVNGNVAILGGEMSLADTGQIIGDFFAMGGKHDLAGQVNGNVSILFGETILRSSAVVRGDMLAAPGTLTREEGAQVNGDVVTRLGRSPSVSGEGTQETGRVPEVIPASPATPEVPEVTPPIQVQPPVSRTNEPGERLARFAGRILAAMLLSILVIVIGVLIALVWPRPTQRVAECIAALPGQCFGLGLLTFLLAAGLEVVAVFLLVLVILVGALLMATIILIPVGLLLILLSGLVLLPVPLALVGGVLLGWEALAELVGHKLLDAFHTDRPSPLARVLVGLMVTLVPAVILWIIQPWCCGLPFVIVLTSVGLGAVFHTRFGTQGCQRAAHIPGPAVPPAGTVDHDVALPAAPEEETLPAAAMDQEAGQPDILPPPPPPPPPPPANP